TASNENCNSNPRARPIIASPVTTLIQPSGSALIPAMCVPGYTSAVISKVSTALNGAAMLSLPVNGANTMIPPTRTPVKATAAIICWRSVTPIRENDQRKKCLKSENMHTVNIPMRSTIQGSRKKDAAQTAARGGTVESVASCKEV